MLPDGEHCDESSESALEHPSTLERLPVFLSLKRRRVVIVGGGNVAASKVLVLMSTGAAITLVAPKVVPHALLPGITVRKRHFREQDLDGAWFVVAAATPSVNAKVARAAAS